MSTLSEIPALAADYIKKHGWTTGEFESSEGAVCLHGAIQACTPQTGDAEIVSAVARAKGLTEEWNDDEATEGEVVAALRGLAVTDADLAETFGPQWEAIVALVRRAASLTAVEANDLAVAGGAAGAAARVASWYAAGATARDIAWDAARNAAGVAAWGAACGAAWTAARNAAGALAVRDLIGLHGFTQGHYDTLTKPWAQVIGKVHPED